MRYKFQLAMGAALILIAEAKGQTINWGNDPGDLNFQSQGGSLSSTFTFQFGVFTSGYDPTVNDPKTWGANWVALDTASYNEAAGFFSDSWTVTDNTYQGQQGYLFIFNDADMNLMPDTTAEITTSTSSTQGTEWFLATNDTWTIPQHATEDAQGQGGGQTSQPEEWRVQTINSVLFGSTETQTGDGTTNGATPPGPLTIQTFTFDPIPETGTALLFGALMSIIVMRRSKAPTATG